MIVNRSGRIPNDIISEQNSQFLPFLDIHRNMVWVRKSVNHVVIDWHFREFICQNIWQIWVSWGSWLRSCFLSHWWRVIRLIFSLSKWRSCLWWFRMRFSEHWRFWSALRWCWISFFHVMVRCLLFLAHRRWDFLLSLWLHCWFIICKSSISNRRLWIYRCSTLRRFVNRLLWRNSSCHKVISSWLLHRLCSRCCCCIRLLIFLEIKICCLSPIPLRSNIVALLSLKCWFSAYQVNIWALIRLWSLWLFFIQLGLISLDLFSFQRQLLPLHFNLMLLINNRLDGVIVILRNFVMISHNFLIQLI